MHRLILASASAARLDLLRRALGFEPEMMISDINEDLLKQELPRNYVERLASQKADVALNKIDSGYVIAADTAVVLGRSVLPKAIDHESVRSCLAKISGKSHRVYTGLCVSLKQSDQNALKRIRVVMTKVKFKRLTTQEIDSYVLSGEGLQKAGGYDVRGSAQCLIPSIQGSISNIIGLPLFELKNMLFSLGYKL